MVVSRQRAEVSDGRMLEKQPCEPLAGGRRVVELALELETAARDQVIADVMRAVGVGPLVPGAFRRGNGTLRDVELVDTGTARQLFHRLPVAVARRAIHVDVSAGRIATKDSLDAADALDERRPVERRQRPHRIDDVGDG